ncbi:MAG: TrmH family RNA methyltransferase [Puniceicoccaceae bacterium]
MDQPDPRSEEALIAHLLQFVTPEKKARMETVIANRTSHVRVVLEDIYQPHNASAVMRSCECFGIQHLHVIENRYKYTLNRDVAMGSSKWINLHRHREEDSDNTRACMDELRADGYRIVATSLDPSSVPLPELPVEEKFSLWFGTEEEGLSETALKEADAHVHIPMLGFTQSFNISVSAAICLYEIRARLAKGPINTSLDAAEMRQVYRLWLHSTLKNCEIVERTFLEGLKEAP